VVDLLMRGELARHRLVGGDSSVRSTDRSIATCSAMTLQRVLAITSATTRDRISPVSTLARDRTGVLCVLGRRPPGTIFTGAWRTGKWMSPPWRFFGSPPIHVSSATMVPTRRLGALLRMASRMRWVTNQAVFEVSP
jgi:hypothetical protein